MVILVTSYDTSLLLKLTCKIVRRLKREGFSPIFFNSGHNVVIYVVVVKVFVHEVWSEEAVDINADVVVIVI